MRTRRRVEMTEVSPERLLEIGRELHARGERWHNHVLSADCRLNHRSQPALIVEASDAARVFVAYTDVPRLDVGRALATMVHGADPLQGLTAAAPGAEAPERPASSTERAAPAVSPAVEHMMQRARSMTERGLHWHHHILLPECIFNSHPGEWTIVFEDPEHAEPLESVTAHRPAEDIRVTETLFFSQTVEG